MPTGTPNVLWEGSFPGGSGSAGSPYTFNPLIPQADYGTLCAIIGTIASGSAPYPTVVNGANLTWSLIPGSQVRTADGLIGISIYKGVGASPNGNDMSVQFGQLIDGFGAVMFDVPGSDAVNPVQTTNVKTRAMTGTTPDVVLDNDLAAGSASYGFLVARSTTIGADPDTGYTQLAPSSSTGTPSMRFFSEYRIDGAKDIGWVTDSSAQKAVVGFEVKTPVIITPGDPGWIYGREVRIG